MECRLRGTSFLSGKAPLSFHFDIPAAQVNRFMFKLQLIKTADKWH